LGDAFGIKYVPRDGIMKFLVENWRNFNLQSKIRKALRDEGGAAGMDALKNTPGFLQQKLETPSRIRSMSAAMRMATTYLMMMVMLK
jgi:hypothetical protein